MKYINRHEGKTIDHRILLLTNCIVTIVSMHSGSVTRVPNLYYGAAHAGSFTNKSKTI